MTQGLQFSLMFSGLDSLPATDSSAMATNFNATDDAAQAGVFQQMLEEQQPSSGRVGQSFAATPRAAEGAIQNKAAATTAATDLVDEQSIDIAVATDSDVTEQTNIADQWLGLIRQANDTSQQLQQKMTFSAQQIMLSKAAAEQQSASALGDEANLLMVAESSADNVIELAPAVTTTNDTASNTIDSSETIDAVDTDLSQNADKTASNTPVNGLDKPVKEPASDMPLQPSKVAGISVTAINDNTAVNPDKPADALAEQSQLSEQAPKLEEPTPKPVLDDGQEAAKNNTANVPATAVIPADANEPETTLHETVKPTELAAALEAQQNTTPDRLPGISPVKPEHSNVTQPVKSEPSFKIAPVNSEQNIKIDPAKGEKNLVVDPVAVEELLVSEQEAQLTSVQAQSVITSENAEANKTSQTTIESAKTDDTDKIISDDLQLKESSIKSNEPVNVATAQVINRTGSTDENSSKVATVESGSKQATSTIAADSAGKDASSSDAEGKQQQPRQDARNTVIDRLDVTVSSAHSQQRVAGAEHAGITFAEAQAQVAEQSNRTSPAQAPTPSLSAQLKQLNLQQQDAALQLRERVQFMVRQNIQVAEIRLDPADLGQMQIRINLQQEQASVQFIVQQQHTRELLEQQMPRLRELLQQQGIQLGEGQVQQQARQDRQSNEQNNQREQHGNNGRQQHDGSDELATGRAVEVKYSERIVDYYA